MAVGLRGGESHVYRVTGAPGSFLSIGVEQRGVDVAVRLLGTAVEVDSPTGERGVEPLPLILDRSGEARLEIRAAPGTQGSYVILAAPPVPATERHLSLVAAERTFARAETLRRRGDAASLRAALELDRDLPERFRALGEPAREADVLERMGRLHQDLGETAPALAAYGRAAALARGIGAAGDAQRAWSALCGLGVVHRQRGEAEAALARFEEALAVQAPLRDPDAEAQTRNHLGRAQADLGQVEPALASYERALALWRRLGRGEGEALANLGRLYAALGETGLALNAFEGARSRFEAAGSERELAGVLVGLGVTLRDAGRAAEAGPPLLRALRLYRRLGLARAEAVTLNELGRLSQRAGRPDAARRAYEAALAVFRARGYRHDEAVVLTNLGRLALAASGPREAAASFEAALPLFRAAGSRLGAASAWSGLARCRRALGDPDAALDASGRALAEIESLRREPVSLDLRASFFASGQDAYHLHAAILLERRRVAEALETVERARARVFLDALARAGRFADTGREARPSRAAEIRRELAPGTLLLEYALADEGSWLFAVTSGDVEAFPLPPRREIEERARAVHALLAEGDSTLGRGPVEEALIEMSEILLGPVADRLGERRLLLVPDGALHSLPFAALPALADRELASLPSASSLVALRRAAAGRTPAPGAVAVLADPDFPDRDGRFPRLVHSRQEARAILSLVPPSDAFAAMGRDFRRATVESGVLARYRVVHFATHGVLDEEHPERSGILLSDGFLRSRDVLRLRLAADLVVLSACRTALGREVRGEGTVGLTRSFFYAGARRVLVSLWPVDDEATAGLMRRFYAGLLRGGRSPAAALRDARLALRRERGWESPYYWAGFVLQGEG